LVVALAIPADAQTAGTDASVVAGLVSTANLIRWTGTLPEATGRKVDVSFTIYQESAGGPALWSETQPVKIGSDGRYTVLLGASSAEGLPQALFHAGEARWIEARPIIAQQIASSGGYAISSSGRDTISDESNAMPPSRSLLTAVPYAFKSTDSDTLAGRPADDYVTREDLESAVANQVQAIQANQVQAVQANQVQAIQANQVQAVQAGKSHAVRIVGLPHPIVGVPLPIVGVPLPIVGTSNTSGSGTSGFLPIWSTSSTLGSSLIAQYGANIGIGTVSPATLLDVNGASTLRGTVSLLATAATLAVGINSPVLQLGASTYSSTSNTAVPQNFVWQAQSAGNNTASPSANLTLLFGSDTTAPSPTGLSISPNGQITFAPSQTFPGVGAGTITGITTGPGLTGGGSSGNVTLALSGPVSTANGGTGAADPADALANLGGISSTQTTLQTLAGPLSGTSIGIATTTPATPLDVNGASTLRGAVSMPASIATANQGANSPPLQLGASSYSSANSTAVPQNFVWQAQSTGNNTISPTANLTLLFGSDTTAPTPTGLSISPNGQITFAPSQTFPGVGAGSITGITTGPGLTGGGSSGNVTLALSGPVSTANGGTGAADPADALANLGGISSTQTTLQTLAGPLSGTSIGIATTTPATPLDVNGASTLRGAVSLPASIATANQGANSPVLQLGASSYSSANSTAVPQNFVWQAQSTGNNTTSPTANLALLFGSGTTAPSPTGLSIAPSGQITFAPSQTFPGVGVGTITGITTGPGLTGGGSSGNVTLALSGPVSTANGGTGAADPADALANLGGISSTQTTLQTLAGPLSGTSIGIATTTPATPLDVNGASTLRGAVSLPASIATANQGANSPVLQLGASSYSSANSTAVPQNFVWQAQSTGNNTTSPTANLALLFGSGTTAPSPTGLSIAPSGQITFAPSQTFPGVGVGTITGITTGPGLTGGGSSGNVTLALSGPVSTANGGTGAADPADALANLGGISSTQTTLQTLAGPLSGTSMGIATTTPATPLDVNGASTLRGTVSLPASVATANQGADSPTLQLGASTFSSTSNAAVPQNFAWQAVNAGNNTANPTANLALLFGSDTTAPSQTGLSISPNGQITFAPSQTFPGVGAGTITGITTGPGLTGGGSSGNVTLALSGPVSTANGGTGAADPADALANLGGISSTQTTLQTLAGPLSGTSMGIATTTPATPLDVNGASTLRGTVSLPASVATANQGADSPTLQLGASSYSSANSTAVPQNFVWQAQSTGNNTTSPTANLALLFGSGTTTPSQTGLSISPNGQITFAPGQMFPGTSLANGSSGTITGVIAGTGLTGGGSNGNIAIALSMPVSTDNGGTGASTASGALANLNGVSSTLTTPQTMAGPLNTPVSNQIQHAEMFPGSTADVKIKACLAALPSGGTCDARGFGATTQRIASTVMIPANTTLLADLATKFQPSSTGLTMFLILPNAHIDGVWVDMSNVATNTWSGNVFEFAGNFDNGQLAYLSHFLITANYQGTGGNGVLLSATTGNSVLFVNISHGSIFGTQSPVMLSATGTGTVNANQFDNITVTGAWGAGNGFVFYNTGTSEIASNQFVNCNAEMSASPGYGVYMLGTGIIRGNTFNVNIWDGTHSYYSVNASAIYNSFTGEFDAPIIDPSTQGNTFNNVSSGPIKLASTITLTAATSDSASISGVTASSHCVFSPTNSTATGATILPYISAMSAGSVTITHAATVGNGATYNIVCTVN
jgi:hypothetical protein